MNLKNTGALFALLLGTLWLFGLMQAYRSSKVDESFILPTLQKETDVTWDSITVERHEKDKQETIEFTHDKDAWTMKLPKVEQPVKVDGGRITRILNDIKGARKTDEAPVGDIGTYKLDRPTLTFTLKGKVPVLGKAKETREKTWVFKVGGESADKVIVYVNSSDRPNRAFPVARSSIAEVFFKDPNYLRSKLLWEPRSDTQYDEIALKDQKAEVGLKRVEADLWRFVQPPLGFADYEGTPMPKELKPEAKPAGGGVKALLSAIRDIRVSQDEDFIPPGSELAIYGLDPGKESLVIELRAQTDKTDPKDKDKKLVETETLRVGFEKKTKDATIVYARLGDDPGVFKLDAKLLEPIREVLRNPGKLRSKDVSFLDTKKVDAVVIRQGKEEVKLIHPDDKKWEVVQGKEKAKKADEKRIEALLEALKGQREITGFKDEKAGKFEADIEVQAYSDGLDRKKEEKDTKKDAKSKDKKDEKKADKKDEKKDEPLELKKDAKPALTLRIGKESGGQVPVERVLPDGTTSHFFVAKSWLDKVAPGDVTLAYLDTALPELNEDEIQRVEIDRGKTKVEILKGTGEKANRWFIKDAVDSSGKSLADTAKTYKLLDLLIDLRARKWLQKLPGKDELKKFGLEPADLTVTILVKKDKVLPGGAASMLGMMALPTGFQGLMAEASNLAQREADKGETIVLKFGSETGGRGSGRDKAPAEEAGVYAMHSGKDLLFLVAPDVVKTLREIDLRDRSSVLLPTPLLAAGWSGMVAGDPYAALLGVSPLVTQRFPQFDSSQVKEVKLAVRTPLELRVFSFQRKPAEKKAEDKKTEEKKDDKQKQEAKKDEMKEEPKAAAAQWSDASGLLEFHLDSEKVNRFLEELAVLEPGRWVSFGAETKPEQKLDPKHATLKIDLTLDSGKTVTLLVGAAFEKAGHYAQSTAWPNAVFFLPASRVEPLLRGPAYFAKERTE